ncbi:MAG: tyrosine-type recombinase/integrase [Phycisphaerae bacterium]|jgi:integrase
MASLKKRKGRNGDVTYYAQYYVGSKQRRVRLNAPNYQAAKEKLRQLESALAGDGDNPLPSRTPLANTLERYVRHARTTKAAKQAQGEIYILKRIFGPVCEALKNTSRRLDCKPQRRKEEKVDLRRRPHVIERRFIEEISTADIATFIEQEMEERDWSTKTANSYRQVLSALFSWAMDLGGIRMPKDRNPAQKLKPYPEEACEITFLSLEDIDEQLAALADFPQIQVMVAMYIYAGLRREEAMWLNTADIDFNAGEHGMIRVQAKTVNGRFWQPKTKRNRAVPISTTLRKYLEAYTPRATEENWYFPSPRGRWWDPDNFSQDLARLNQAAGLEWACLDFRHTFGSLLAQRGKSLYHVSALMGNSPEICRKHYAALIPEAMADTVEFGPAPAAPRAPQAGPRIALRYHEPPQGPQTRSPAVEAAS